MYSFNNRQVEIITYLLQVKDYSTAKKISDKFKVSIRTVRYDLDVIEEWLLDNHAVLEKVPSKGMMVKSKLNRQVLFEKLKLLSIEDRMLSEEERVDYIILTLLSRESEFTMTELSEKLLVSRNTALKLVKKVKDQLSKYNLQLDKVHAKGFRISGCESDKRFLLVDIFIRIININNIMTSMQDQQVYEELLDYCKRNYPLYVFEYIKEIFNDCLEVENDYEFYLTDMALFRLLIYIVVCISRLKLGLKASQLSEISRDTEEYLIGQAIGEKIMTRFNLPLSEEEIGVIANYMIESKSFSHLDSRKDDDQDESQEISRMTDFVVKYAENELNVRLSNDQQLQNDLYYHIKSLIVRMKNDKQLDSEYTLEITKRFPLVFQIVKESLKKYCSNSVLDSEIAYITLHISAAYERNYQENYMSTALVICQEGVSFLRTLVTKLKRNIPRLRIIESCSIYEYEKYKKKIDLVITTSNFKPKDIEVVKVGVFLENDSIYRIRQTLVKLNKIKQIYRYNQIRNSEGGRIILLEQLLNIDMIKLGVKADDWEDSIRKASLPLLKYNKVDNVYVENMVNAVKELGPYIVIMPGIAFAHARPDESVKETCMSMMTLETPVEFGSEQNDPVSIVFAFGAENGDDHLKAIQDLAKFLALEENVEFLINAKDKQVVLNKLLDI